MHRAALVCVVSTVLLHVVSTQVIDNDNVQWLPKLQTTPTQVLKLWGVVTTILEVNVAVEKFVVKNPHAGLVVVGDLKTNHSEWESFAKRETRVVYLHPHDQKNLFGINLVNYIPWNHFGRKNIGFMYAIQHGAERIFDFDDDNHLTQNMSHLANMARVDVHMSHHVYNPYPYGQVRAMDAVVWPRGFPLQFINDADTYNATATPSAVPYERVAVVQSLANHDPDVDAIFRMTRTLPVTFTWTNTIVIPPRGTFTPWNAQAVLVSRPAFFGMLLPVTVNGRVSDIWRSFVTSRLLWETDYYVGFSSPIVSQYRNPHLYMQDFEDEDDLYHKTDLMLSTLAKWTSDGCNTLDVAYLDLVRKIAQQDLIGVADVELANAWVANLASIGYEWPHITRRHVAFEPRARQIVDQRLLVGQSPILPDTQINSNGYGKNTRREIGIIVMTKDDPTLMSQWLTYHGHVYGFENLYILDGSTGSQKEYLQRAATQYQFHLRHSDSGLNRLTTETSEWIDAIRGSYDWIIKVDTDEFIVHVHDGKPVPQSRLYLPSPHDTRLLRVHWVFRTQPSPQWNYTDLEMASVANAGRFKQLYSGVRFSPTDYNLGSHVGSSKLAVANGLGIIHYTRPYDDFVAIALQVIQSHGYVSDSDTKTVMISKLQKFRGSVSFHKVAVVLDHLTNPAKSRLTYYSEGTQLPPLRSLNGYYTSGKPEPILRDFKGYCRKIFTRYPSLFTQSGAGV